MSLSVLLCHVIVILMHSRVSSALMLLLLLEHNKIRNLMFY